MTIPGRCVRLFIQPGPGSSEARDASLCRPGTVRLPSQPGEQSERLASDLLRPGHLLALGLLSEREEKRFKPRVQVSQVPSDLA